MNRAAERCMHSDNGFIRYCDAAFGGEILWSPLSLRLRCEKIMDFFLSWCVFVYRKNQKLLAWFNSKHFLNLCKFRLFKVVL